MSGFNDLNKAANEGNATTTAAANQAFANPGLPPVAQPTSIRPLPPGAQTNQLGPKISNTGKDWPKR